MWYKKFGGRKFFVLLFGIILPTYLVFIGAFLTRIEMAFNLAKDIYGIAIVGMVAYIGGNVVQHIKRGSDEHNN